MTCSLDHNPKRIVLTVNNETALLEQQSSLLGVIKREPQLKMTNISFLRHTGFKLGSLKGPVIAIIRILVLYLLPSDVESKPVWSLLSLCGKNTEHPPGCLNLWLTDLDFFPSHAGHV